MKNKRMILTNIDSLTLLGAVIGTQLSVVSCSIVKKTNDNTQENIALKEENIITKIEENSKLTNEERQEYKEKQKEEYSDWSIEKINNFLLENMNMTLRQYFVNLNSHNNLSMAWANPISIVIDAFDLVLSIIEICNDIFLEVE